MFENQKIYVASLDEYVHMSRIIASWRNVAKRYGRKGLGFGSNHFATWLNEIGVSDEDARMIYTFQQNGKLELENAAERYLNNLDELI